MSHIANNCVLDELLTEAAEMECYYSENGLSAAEAELLEKFAGNKDDQERVVEIIQHGVSDLLTEAILEIIVANQQWSPLRWKWDIKLSLIKGDEDGEEQSDKIVQS